MKFKVPINHLFLKAMKTIACTKFSLIFFGRKTVNIKEFRENKFWSQSDPAVWYKMKWCFIHKTLVSYVNSHPLPQKIINTSTHKKKVILTVWVCLAKEVIYKLCSTAKKTSTSGTGNHFLLSMTAQMLLQPVPAAHNCITIWKGDHITPLNIYQDVIGCHKDKKFLIHVHYL